MDYGEYGGALFLGVNGVVIVAHGRAEGPAIKNALRAASESVNSGMLDALRALHPRASSEAVPSSAASSSGETTT
jgi:glycerol-3-phosphate acyltransferase PlsX